MGASHPTRQPAVHPLRRLKPDYLEKLELDALVVGAW